MTKRKFAVLGGDLRQSALAEGLAELGHTVGTFAIEGAPGGSLEQVLAGAECVILPLPAFDEAGCVSGTGRSRAHIDDLLAQLRPGVRVFGGKLGPEAARFARAGIPAVDYLLLEQMAAANAVPTAEGAIQLAMERLPVTIQGSRCLVIGWGRIGKVLSHKLCCLGAEVTVAARKESDTALIRALGMHADVTGRYERGLSGYDWIVNTVPATVLGRNELAQTGKGCLIMDLASAPGGVDVPAAAELDRTAIRALSLPGKVAPVTAGRIIRDAILCDLDRR